MQQLDDTKQKNWTRFQGFKEQCVLNKHIWATRHPHKSNVRENVNETEHHFI